MAITSAPITISANYDPQEIKSWLDSKRNYSAGIKLYFKYGNDPLLLMLFKEEYSEFKRVKLAEVLEALITAPAAKPSEEKLKETKVVASVMHMSDAIDKFILDNIEKDVDALFSKHDDIEDSHSYLESRVGELADDHDKLKKDVDQLKKTPKFIAKGWPPVMDETLQKLHDEWHPLFTEKKFLQATVYEVALAGKKDPIKKEEAREMVLRILELGDKCRVIYKKRNFYKINNTLPEEPKLIDIPKDKKRWPVTYQNWMRYKREYEGKLRSIPITPENEKKIEGYKKQLERYLSGIAELKQLLGYE